MADPKPGVVLNGLLQEVRWDGDEVTAMDDLFDRAEKDPFFVGRLDPDATIGNETGLRHFTNNKGWAVFFRWGNIPPTLSVYAVGRHKHDDNKKYELHTFETGTKTKLYTF
jgi:hypothetical protein